MLQKFRAFEAPIKYDFKDPDTGLLFQASSEQELTSQIIAYRAQNNLEPIDGLHIVLENYWCQQAQNAGKCQNCTEEITRGFTTYIKGGIALLKTMMFKRFASQEVAEARAKQCSTCRYNVAIEKTDAFFKWSNDIAIQCVGQRKTSLDDKIYVCAVCTCVLKSKVHIQQPLDPFTPKQVERMKSVNCWQLSLSGQDK